MEKVLIGGARWMRCRWSERVLLELEATVTRRRFHKSRVRVFRPFSFPFSGLTHSLRDFGIKMLICSSKA